MREKNRFFRRKSGLLFLAAGVLLVCLGAGGTAAWFHTKAPALVNHLETGSVACRVEENFDPDTGVKEQVRVENTGTVTAYLRVALVYNRLEDGTVVSGRQVPEDALRLTGWLRGADGFYYWTAPVAPGASTGVLIPSLTLAAGEELQVIASAIQADPEEAVESAWGAVEVSDGRLIGRAQ